MSLGLFTLYILERYDVFAHFIFLDHQKILRNKKVRIFRKILKLSFCSDFDVFLYTYKHFQRNIPVLLYEFLCKNVGFKIFDFKIFRKILTFLILRIFWWPKKKSVQKHRIFRECRGQTVSNSLQITQSHSFVEKWHFSSNINENS